MILQRMAIPTWTEREVYIDGRWPMDGWESGYGCGEESPCDSFWMYGYINGWTYGADGHGCMTPGNPEDGANGESPTFWLNQGNEA